MHCPYCKRETEQGFIQSPQQINWKTGEKRPFLGTAAFHKDSIVLSKLSLTKGSAVAAHLCRNCQKIIIDYGNENSDLNQ